MLSSLPRHPSLEHLRKQAKQLLGAQRHGLSTACIPLRRLHRFSSSTDQDILGAELTLAEAQLALAMQYGFPSWKSLMDEARSHPASQEHSLEGVRHRAEDEIPEYAGAGVPMAVVAALNHAGFPIRYMEFVAASGWAFSFGYHYRDISPAFLAVRGRPGADGPMEVFAFLPGLYGLAYEMARTGDQEELWRFAQEKVESGTPVMSEHMDGGLITSVRVHEGRRQLFFDGTVCPGWIDADSFQPFAAYSFVPPREPLPITDLGARCLQRAWEKGREHSLEGIPHGLGGLRRYLEDVADPGRDFSDVPEWFCWAAFERLMARRCCEVWLRSLAPGFQGSDRSRILKAAEGYGEAFRRYDRFRSAVHGGEPTRLSLRERARTPERIDEITPLLRKAIEEEAAGLEALGKAVRALG